MTSKKFARAVDIFRLLCDWLRTCGRSAVLTKRLGTCASFFPSPQVDEFVYGALTALRLAPPATTCAGTASFLDLDPLRLAICIKPRRSVTRCLFRPIITAHRRRRILPLMRRFPAVRRGRGRDTWWGRDTRFRRRPSGLRLQRQPATTRFRVGLLHGHDPG